MNKFDKPYRVLPTYDMKKAIELFNFASKLDTFRCCKYLIHKVISIDMRIATRHSKLIFRI